MRTLRCEAREFSSGQDGWIWAQIVLFTLLFVVALFHFTRLTSETVHREYLKTSEEIVTLVREYQAISTAPLKSDAIGYFEELVAKSQAENQCRLMRRVFKGIPAVPEGLAQAYRECFGADQSLTQFTTSERYRAAFSAQEIGAARERFDAEHPGWEQKLIGSDGIETKFHGEEILYLYAEGMGLSFLVFLIRLKGQGFNIWFEILMGRLPFSLLAWPVTLFAYRGDPKQQLRDLVRVVTVMVSTAFSVICPIAVKAASPEKKKDEDSPAAELSWSGGMSLQNQYVLNSGFVPTPGPVIQPWVEASHVATGAYLNLWASSGMQTPDGQEVDVTVGWRSSIEGLRTDLSYNYYRLIPKLGIHAPQAVVCGGEVCGKVQLVLLDTGGRPGSQTGLWWQHDWQWNGVATNLGMYHIRGPGNTEPVTMLKGDVSMPIGDSPARWFVTLYRRLAGGDAGTSDHQIVTGLRFAF